MKPRHTKYKIKLNDTLSKITNIFGVDEDIWKRYHNNMCTLDDIIRENLPKHLKEIYLLPELWEKEKDFNKPITEIEFSKTPQKINFGHNKTMVMSIFKQKLIYKVSIRIDSVNFLEYNVSVKCVEKEDLLHTIEINKLTETYKINGLEADLIADELAIKTASALYPLKLLVTYRDGIIGISNVGEIQKRWIDIKRNILDYNEGEIVDKYLRFTEKSIKNEKTLLLSLKNDWFLHTYFNNIYQTYTSEYSIYNQIVVPFIFNTDGVIYNVQQKINKDLDQNRQVNVTMKGKPSDSRSISDLESKLDYTRYSSDSSLKGEYDAVYIIEPQFNTIEEVKLHTKLELEKTKTIDIHIIKVKE